MRENQRKHRKTKLPLWCQTMELMDPSSQITTLQWYIHFLPSQKRIQTGDVVVLENMKLEQTKEDDIQLVGCAGSSTLLTGFSKFDDSDHPAFTYSQWTALQELWHWGQGQFATTRNTTASGKICQLQDVSTSSSTTKRFNLTVMICAILPSSNGGGYVRVWDGTGPPHADEYVNKNYI